MNIYGNILTWAVVAITVGGLTLWVALLMAVNKAIEGMTEIMPRRRL